MSQTEVFSGSIIQEFMSFICLNVIYFTLEYAQKHIQDQLVSPSELGSGDGKEKSQPYQ